MHGSRRGAGASPESPPEEEEGRDQEEPSQVGAKEVSVAAGARRQAGRNPACGLSDPDREAAPEGTVEGRHFAPSRDV
jgi:hypothetical protein